MKPADINFRSLKAVVIGSVVLTLLIAALLVGLNWREREQRKWVDHTYEVILLMRNIVGSVSSAELAVRGYVITGDPSNLPSYTQIVGTPIEKLLSDLRSLISDNPRQVIAAQNATDLVRENFASLQRLYDIASADGSAAAIAGMNSIHDMTLERRVRAAFLDMQDHELTLLRQRQASVAQARKLTSVAVAILALLAAAWIALSLRYFLATSHQRALSEKLLADSEQRYRLLADNSTDIIARRDTATDRMTYFSPAVKDVLGYTQDELLGDGWMEIIHPEERDHILALKRRIGPDSPNHHSQFRVRKKNGAFIWIESYSAFVPGENGYPPTVQSTWRDISDRKAAEDEAIRMRNEAEKANKAKSDFLAMMSHELRTPMAGVLGLADLLLLGEADTSERQRLTKQLKRSALSLLDILNDILDFSKIEAGKLEIDSEPFSLGDVLTDLRGLFGPAASAKGLVFDVSPAEGLPDAVKGDAKRLRQIMVNLVNNAIKFTNHGSVDLRVEYKRIDAHSIELHGYVRDTGIGISKDGIAKLFKPFVQADASTSRSFGGTGLGLAIARLLTSAMKGRIWVESDLGNGTTFFFVIPLETANNVLATPTIRQDRRASNPRTVRPLRILLAEDTDTVRQVTVAMLTRMGHTVEAVEDGASAVMKAQTDNFDIILMDMQMPVMDGLDATKAIRAMEGITAHTPIIALTADAIYEHREKYITGGLDAVVTKPISWEVLVAKIAQLVPDVAVPSVVDRRKNSRQSRIAPIAPLINEKLLGELEETMGDEVLGTFFNSFRSSVDQYMGEISSALADDDLKRAKRSAHALKGLSSQMGADRIATVADFIEVEAGTLDQAREQISNLASVAAETLMAMSAKYGWAVGQDEPTVSN